MVGDGGQFLPLSASCGLRRLSLSDPAQSHGEGGLFPSGGAAELRDGDLVSVDEEQEEVVDDAAGSVSG